MESESGVRCGVQYAEGSHFTAGLERAVEIARRIASAAPLATRANVRKLLWEGREAAAAELGDQQRRLYASEDAAEGVRSFSERRAGRFTGR